MFVDSHAHFDHLPDPRAVAEVLSRARAAGVGRIVAIGGHAGANAQAADIAEAEGGLVWAAVGYDRDQAPRDPPVDALRPWLARERVVAVGEIGLDYHYEPETRSMQIALFEQMLSLAREFAKPVIMHSREADEDTLAILKRHMSAARDGRGLPGVLHCFTGTAAFAACLLDLGLMIGFSGIITFKNAHAVREVAKTVPEDRLLIETDSPYLAPEPHRGKQNEPAHVALVAEALAKIRNDTVEHIAHITARNAQRLFKPDGPLT